MVMRTLAFVVVILTLSTGTVWADARSDAKAQVGFGIVVAQHGLWQEARYRFERAVSLDPTYAEAHNNLAIACEQLGLVDEARENYRKALALDPGNDFIHGNYDLYEELHARDRSDRRR